MVLAALVCRYGLASRKRISYGMLTVSPIFANAAVFMSFAVCWMGTQAFSLSAWQDVKGVKDIWLAAGAIAVVCLFPALGIAVYYEGRKMSIVLNKRMQ